MVSSTQLLNNLDGDGIGTMCGQVAEFSGGITKLSTILWWLKSVYSGGSPAYEYQKYGSVAQAILLEELAPLKLVSLPEEAILLIL